MFVLLAILVASYGSYATLPAHALLQIDITQGNVDPLPIAVPEFIGQTETEARIGADIARVIGANLDRSGLFKPLDPRSFIEKQINFANTPRFGDWRIINAQALVTGQVVSEDDGRLRVEFRLWDIFAEQQMVGFAFETTPENWRRVSHLVSDAIYERLTGEKGYFDTRVVFIAESGGKGNRKKRLAIMDQDGANPSFLTDGSYLVMTPRFNPTTQKITYLSYFSGKPRVYLFDIESGRQRFWVIFQV